MIAQPSLKMRLRDYILDEALCPVARMRLFSDGMNPNTRIFQHEAVIGDRACLACGNCVDACPVVRDKERFVLIQNQRTSMALEHLVAEECRRCYRCVLSCPQVSKSNKEYAASFRRGEKIVHLLIAVCIVLLAATGIAAFHYGELLSGFERSLLKIVHWFFGLALILMPLVYLIVDRQHLSRLLRRIVKWDHTDRQWLQDMMRHIKDSKNAPLPYVGEFNSGQKAWYLYVSVMIPVMGVTGLILMLGSFSEAHLGYVLLKWLHVAAAMLTDLLLFVHIYLKYLRKWAVTIKDVVRVYRTRRHLNYAALYGKKD